MNTSKFSSSILFPDPSIFRTTTNYKRKHQHNDDEILAFGYESKIYNDQSIASKVEKGHYLIPWKSSNFDMWMDRYDVRHLIEDQDIFLVNQKAMLEEEYDTNRYADLYNEDIESDNRHQNKAAIPYDYDNNKRVKVDNNEEHIVLSEIEKEIMVKYKTPKSMVVPNSKEQVSIIEATSKEISLAPNSNLLEIRIQVKNANNSLYSFLNKQDILYPFFKYIGTIPAPTTVPALSNLVAYSDSEESEGEEEEPPLDIKQVIIKIAESIAKSNNSNDLERHIRTKKGQDPKFGFLNNGNVYYNYFKSKIKESKGKGNSK